MKRISLLSRKGGVAKTLSAMAIAQILSDYGATAVLDLDPEGSASSWALNAEERGAPLPYRVYNPVSIAGDPDVSRLEYLIVDTPPNDSKTLLMAARSSDTILIPMQPGQSEIDRLEPTLQVLREHHSDLRSGVRLGIMLTMAEHDRLSAAMPEVLRQLEYPFVGSVRKSVEYRRSFGGQLRSELLVPFMDILAAVGALPVRPPVDHKQTKRASA